MGEIFTFLSFEGRRSKKKEENENIELSKSSTWKIKNPRLADNFNFYVVIYRLFHNSLPFSTVHVHWIMVGHYKTVYM